jgi:hypothetical protein
MATPIADMVEKMLSTGIPPEMIVLAVRTAEEAAQAAQPVGDQTAEKRRAWDRDRKRKLNAKQIPPEFHNGGDISSSLPSLNSSLEKEERSEIVALGRGPKYSAAFEEFYRQYPRHEGKRDAFKVWLRVTKSEVSNADLIIGAMRYAADPNRDPTFTKHCATWLNKGCWSDGPLPPRGQQNGRAKETPIEQAKRLADEWTRREHAAGIYGADDDAGGHRSRG